MLERARSRRQRTLGNPRIHARGESRLDAMLELAQVAATAAPLPEVLALLCERIARTLAIDVCSVYLRERALGKDELVLRATVGHPIQSIGRVRLAIGEGLTGFAVECLRPISVARAADDARNRAFDGVDERRYPALCAVPLVTGGRAVGALVVQRGQPRAFTDNEVVLVAAVATPVVFALERAQAQWGPPVADASPVLGRPHGVILRGEGQLGGGALGTIAVRRRAPTRRLGERRRLFEGRRDRAPLKLDGHEIADERARLGSALAAAASEIAALESWACAQAADRTAMRSLLSPSRFVLEDVRLRERMMAEVERGAAAVEAVERALAEYARVLGSAEDGLLTERALEVEALCLRVIARLAGPSSPAPPGRVLAASSLTVCEAIELKADHGVGVLLAAPIAASPGIAVARALGIPVVAGIGELFRWVADQDRALVDADAGLVILNPSRVDVAAHRRRSRMAQRLQR